MSNINNHNPHGREGVLYSTGTIPTRHVYKTLVLSLFLTCLSFVLLPTIIASANATTEAAASVNWTPLSLALSDGGDVSFVNLVPSTDGTMEVVKKTVSVETTGKAYAVYLSMDNDSNRLHYNGDASSTLGIPATSGSFSSPATFTGRGWGYAVPDVNHFSSSSVYNSYALGENVFSSDTGYNTGLWAAVPTKDSAQKIYSGTIPSNRTNDSFDVYYAVMVDNDLIAGTYSNYLVYTALASANSLSTVSNNLSVKNLSTTTSQRYVTHGDTLSLNFDLATSQTDLVKTSDVSIYLVPHSLVASANYTLTDSLKDNKASYPQCIIGNSSSDFTITHDASSGGIINCTIETSANGTVAGVEGNNDGLGSYDVWLNLEKYGVNYFSKYLTSDRTSTLPSIVFAGLQSKDSSGYLVTKMQEMTGSICKNTNEWNNQTGESARIYDYKGQSGNNPLLSAGTDTLGISTFALTDVRDNKDYLIRRLADGNCWMVQNLDLDLASFAGTRNLTKANTDLNSKEYWDPSESIRERGLGYYNNRPECEQFISYGNYIVNGRGCHWAGNTSDDGTTVSTDTERTAVPRSYDNQYDYYEGSTRVVNSTYSVEHATQFIGDYYNWYAATAESGRYGIMSAPATDTICPYGWQFPVYANASSDKTHAKLFTAYNITYDNGNGNASDADLKALANLPLSLTSSHYYDGGSAAISSDSLHLEWYSTAFPNTYQARHLAYYTDRKQISVINTGSSRIQGFVVRCVAR